MSKLSGGDTVAASRSPTAMPWVRWRLLLAGMVLTTPPLFVPLHFSVNAELWERLMDVVHLPYFAGITVLFFCSLRQGRASRLTRALLAGSAAIIWAGLVEILQPFTGRTEDIVDFRNGAFGAGLTVLALVWPRLWPLAIGSGAALTLFAIQPAWQEFRGIHWRASHFPLLGDFESDDELRLWIAPAPEPGAPRNTLLSRSTDFATRGKYSLQVGAIGAGYPGVRFLAANQDWRGYTTLAFDIYDPDGPLTLGLRIDDAGSTDRTNRFQGSISLTNGWNHHRFPLDKVAASPPKPLHLEAVRRVILFFDDAGRTAQRTFYLDNVRLERD